MAEKTLRVPHEPLHQTKLSMESALSLKDGQSFLELHKLDTVTQSCVSLSASQATNTSFMSPFVDDGVCHEP